MTHLKPETKALVLWHDESGTEMGGCHAPIGRGAGGGFAAQHDGVGLLVDGVRDVGDFGARRHGRVAHGLEQVRRDDDRFSDE